MRDTAQEETQIRVGALEEVEEKGQVTPQQ